MAPVYLKKSSPPPEQENAELAGRVQALLARIEKEGAAAALALAREFDGFQGEAVVVPRERVAAAGAELDPELKAAIDFAYSNIRRFAEAQLASITPFETEVSPGLVAGQRLIPVASAGCYVPGGRFAHIASALMTVTTAKVAGVQHITACSPPRGAAGEVPAAILYALDLAGADMVLTLGGVQAVAAMAFGLFGNPAVNILVGPGNAYVAEAKRQLFGKVNIDSLAGPTDLLILADDTADPAVVAWDLIGQAEHGSNSPVWLVTTSAALGEQVLALIPSCLAQLPEPNRSSAAAAWRDLGEVAVCASSEEMAALANSIGPEHLHVQAAELEQWPERLTSYGSLFLGPETTVAFGDKAAGPNHVLPTSGTAAYTGGLSVHKFLKIVTYQRCTPAAAALDRDGAMSVARATAVISRAEGMEGHAITADLRRPGLCAARLAQTTASTVASASS